ncbi:competence type IV pilus major pilin ComGC [Bacillus sp. Marseille-P3661]|uniref:competence type IV pilus major pilin ComGC n=1 Tax=Bacillus sp. Marseille-P3661 TaxID=1936234 RepID=UPI000C862AF3|nr:competence type IV pilus major pilin ComGC [Bacillus sp. Marseille-P3661]
MKKQDGFTLVEMMVVLMVISTLLLVTIPNVTKNNTVVKDKGCEALVKLVEAQIQAYEIEKGETITDLQPLVDGNYIKSLKCPNGDELRYIGNEVTSAPPLSEG